MAYNQKSLALSTDMVPVEGSVEVDIPISLLWKTFTRADWWPRWNRCMFWAANRDLQAGRQLIWAFDPLQWYYFYKLPGIARLAEVEEERCVTWEVTSLPGFYARHTYFMEDLGHGRSRFGSYEKAMGPTFRLLQRFWLAHFIFVKDSSLQGARLLAALYKEAGDLDGRSLKAPSWPRRLKEGGGSVGLLRIQYQQLAPGVYAALGGGGNSLIVADGDEVLLVDSKMPPFTGLMDRWMKRHLPAPVTAVVNTHFHYDHSQGNIHYPAARLIAHRAAPELMLRRDGRWWRKQAAGIPLAENLVDDAYTFKVGSQAVTVSHAGRGHTATDLWLYLRRGDQEIIATGDVASLGIYPFLDRGEGGADIPNMIRCLREWAERYPNAIFVPGHGPVATAVDLRHHADYLAFLYDSVAAAQAERLTVSEAIRNIDLSPFDLINVPMFHYGESILSARSNVTAVYEMLEADE